MHEPMTPAGPGEPPPGEPRKEQDEAPRPGTAAWWLAREKEPARQRRRRALTLDGILDASMALLDARGAAALTMRNVAEALGCTQASLYRHVRNREELVTLLADRAVSVASAVPPDGADWAEKAAWSARLFRAHLRRHPGVVSLLRGTERLGPHALAGVEYSLGLFLGAGLAPKAAFAAASSLATFVIGSVHFNLGLDAQDPEESRHRRQFYRSRDATAFPLLVRHADTVAEVGSDEEFEVGLTALLAGFRSLIENADAPRGRNASP